VLELSWRGTARVDVPIQRVGLCFLLFA
jgi:hypothetical protein